MNAGVSALAVFDDGTGPALYAGGSFTTAGGAIANHIARWDGSTWTPLGSGMGAAALTYTPGVRALTVFDDGSGSALYAGGYFTTAGGAIANHIARWDGSTWTPLGIGVAGTPFATPSPVVTLLGVFDAGSGPRLYVGAWNMTAAGGVPVSGLARWDGSGWSTVPGWNGGLAYDFTVFDDGAGPALYVSGYASVAGYPPGLAYYHRLMRWDGATWIGVLSSPSIAHFYALQAFDDGGGPALFGAGGFYTVGGVAANHIARWDGSTWSALGAGISSAWAHDLEVFDDGSGPALLVAGTFPVAGGASANGVAKWDCASTISVSATQASPGAPVFVNNTNLTPGNEYYNLFAIACPTGPGTCGGPFGANWTTQNVNLVLWQMTRPVGTEPFRVIAPSSYVNWGPYNLPPITLDAICIDFSSGMIGATSPMARLTVQ